MDHKDDDHLAGFKKYIIKRRNRKAAIDSEVLSIEIFIRWLKEKGLSEDLLRYEDIMDYISYCKQRGNKISTISQKIRIIKYWLDYKYIVPNPCKGWHIKRRPHILPPDLFSEIELDKMYYDHPQDTLSEKRDKVILGLMIYQGMNGGHLRRIKLEEVNLDIGFIIIKKTLKTASRSIKIKEAQRALLEYYIKEVRGQISEQSKELLIVKEGQNEELSNFYNGYYKRFRKRYPAFRNIKQMRASVISNWLKHHNLREVQYMAGHKYVSTTERYLESRIEDLQKALDDLHPLK